MKNVEKNARADYNSIDFNLPTIVKIPNTKKSVKLRGITPYTIEKLTQLWLSREDYNLKDSADTLKSMCKEPYFAIKEACILSLNCWWKIILFYPIKWRIWAYLCNYTEEQMLPIVIEGKKKLPLTAHWMLMAYSVDMRTDWMKMTQKEAEQYRAELLSVANQHLSKSSLATEVSSGE